MPMTPSAKYNFKIRFNTEWAKTPDRCWRALINDVEHLVSDVLVQGVPVRTISHVLPTGEKKWSIYCESDSYIIDDAHKLIIG
jgi:hypothetical protein